ncbi:MAG: cytidylate kinase-like family protein [Bacteroidales bacterium]|nr:cytidylate kinase-like family protein [Bacteroidales bacterium]
MTIGRQLGSGGREIGERLAAGLGINCYDKKLIEIASLKSGLTESILEKADEKRKNPLLGGYFELSSTLLNNYANNRLSSEMIFSVQSEVIRSLAAGESCLFVGRCADYVLRDQKSLLNIFITADREQRIERVSSKEVIPLKKASEIIDKSDKERASYYNYFTSKKWGATSSYHLSVSSSLLGIEGTASFLTAFAKKYFEL